MVDIKDTETYNKIINADHLEITRVIIDGVVYGEDTIFSVSTSRQLFSNNIPTVGCCCAGDIDIEMFKPEADIPTMASIVLQVRECLSETYESVKNNARSKEKSDKTNYTEWIDQGHYWIDTRSVEQTEYGDRLVIHGYDIIMMMEQYYCTSNQSSSWGNKTDLAVVKEVVNRLKTYDSNFSCESLGLITDGYVVEYPGHSDGAKTIREVMGYIAAMYCGNWTISNSGKLRLIQLNALLPETFYLVDNVGNVITWGDDETPIILDNYAPEGSGS